MADAGNPAVPQDYYKPTVAPSAEWANPAVLGLMGFGTTTMLAGIANTGLGYGAGFWNDGVFNVLGMAIFFGGLAQLISGVIALRKGEIFAGTAFFGFGAFWMAYVWIVTNGFMNTGGLPPAISLVGLMWFSIVWAIFTFSFLVNAPKHGGGITAVFLWLTVAFILLAINFGSMAPGGGWASGAPGWWSNFMGLEIFITGAIAVYVGFGILTNTNYGRKIIPI